MCRVECFVLAAAVLVGCSGLHMYPEIFDASKFLNRPLALKSDVGRDTLLDDVYSDGGFKDGEMGFVRSSSESGKGGFRHREEFHKKDGNKYGNERQTGFGESKRTGDAKAEDHGRLMVDILDHSHPEPTYEVTEEQSDVENPDKHKKYGLSSATKGKKKPTEKKSKTAKLTHPKPPGKAHSKQKKNHNGYESIVYHENERDSSEHGYGKKKTVGKIPDRKPAKQISHDEDGETFEEDRDEMDSSERHDFDGDSDAGDSGRESDFADNYDSLRFDSDFERSFGSSGEDEPEEAGDGRTAARQDQDYDYDAEVDRDEVDESANEDKYRGDSDEEEEEEGEKADDDRQYEYASEADGDAQDY